MKASVLSLSLAGALAAAQPHNHRRQAQVQQPHRHEKRDAVQTETKTEVVWHTVTAVIFPDTTSFYTPDATNTGGQFHESSLLPAVPSATSTEEAVPVAPTTSSSIVSTTKVVVPTQETELAPPPVQATTFSTSLSTQLTISLSPTLPPVVPTVVPTVVPEPTTSTTAAAPTSTGGSGGGGGGVGSYAGDITHYTVGWGACGWNDEGLDLTEPIVAISAEDMGEKSNGNKWCNKTITIYYDGGSTTATVRDKCMGCKSGSIDVSEMVFLKIFPLEGLGKGRGQVTWSLNEPLDS